MKTDCRVFVLTDLAEMAAVLGKSFSSGEPMAVAAGLTQQDVEEIVKLFGPKADVEGLTIVARSPDGAMLGALLAQDFATPPPPGLDRDPPAFAPIGALLDGLDDSYRLGKSIRPREYLHLFMVGVLPEHERKKIGHALVSTALENAGRKGYRVAVTEATGKASQHIMRQHGFIDRHTVNYADFRFEEKLVFASIVGPSGTVLMDRKLDG
jgi:GNAT superfamily N-acetyltransferase